MTCYPAVPHYGPFWPRPELVLHACFSLAVECPSSWVQAERWPFVELSNFPLWADAKFGAYGSLRANNTSRQSWILASSWTAVGHCQLHAVRLNLVLDWPAWAIRGEINFKMRAWITLLTV